MRRSPSTLGSTRIPNPAIARLARKAGAFRLSALIYEKARTILTEWLETLVRKSVILSDHGRRKTVLEQDVITVLRQMGLDQVGVSLKGRCPVYPSQTRKTKGTKVRNFTHRGGGLFGDLAGTLKSVADDTIDAAGDVGDDLEEGAENVVDQVGGARKHRWHPGTVTRREITYYQRRSECVVIPASIFRRLIRDVASNYKTELKISEPAFLLFQSAAENFLLTLFRRAVMLSVTIGERKTLRPGDLEAALRLPDY